MEIIDLDHDEANELLFKIQIEGIDASPAKIRIVCESGDVGYMFNSKPGPEGLVKFDLPSMKGKLSEGICDARVEVMIDNKYFVPTKFQINFKKMVSVVAESVVIKEPIKQNVVVSAIPIVVQKKLPPPLPQQVVQKHQTITTQQKQTRNEAQKFGSLKERFEKKRLSSSSEDLDISLFGK